MDINTNYDKIEAYLNQSLSTADKANFEQDLKTNPQLKQEVLNHVLANEALGLVIEDKVSGKLEKLAQQRQEAEPLPTIKSSWIKTLSIAASILFLLFTGSMIWTNQKYSNEALAMNAYAESTLPIVRSDVKVNPNYANGLLYFSKRDYTQAIDKLSKIQSSDPSFLEARYVLAHINWQTKNYKKAGELFETLLATSNLPSTIDRQELEWNKTLIMLQEKGANDPAFQQVFTKILDTPQHGYYQKASNLSKQLNSFWRNFVIGS